MPTAIKVENLSKIYRLGEIGTGTISKDVHRWFTMKVLGREDPFLKIGQTNDRTQKGESNVVYSLQDINFEIEQGDAIGIIGRNGAGKSTLLKLLSRVTSPTTGRIHVKGRVASLLEVGTGFHPELTGRENIYLNGAILGMRKHEITSKMDEIIAFSGVERYIDTPVKRYSSGMYVRLAFAVAAHLESEILIVDEVLAVGDAEFQKKCLGKMGEVSKGEGRTVLFVSHNMASIKTLCNKGIVLRDGKLVISSEVDKAVFEYLASSFDKIVNKTVLKSEENIDLDAQIIELSIVNENNVPTNEFDVFDKKYIIFHFKVRRKLFESTPLVTIFKDGVPLINTFLSDYNPEILKELLPGEYRYKLEIPYHLKKGNYSCTFRIGKLRVKDYDCIEEAITFNVEEYSFNPTIMSYSEGRPGILPCLINWKKI